MQYTATYSPEDNKLRIYASARLDPATYARVRAAGFIWAPKQDLFVAPMWTPARADLCTELAGEIDDEDRTLVERAEDRADRFEGYQERRAQDSERAQTAVAAIADGIPLGQPILIGHHSERHARKDAERIENGMRRAVKMWETSLYWQRRAAGAIAHAKYKELPRTRARRIKVIEADKRRQQRQITESRKLWAVWLKIDDPGRDDRPCDDVLRRTRAEHIANYLDHGTYAQTYTHPGGHVGRCSYQDALRDPAITIEMIRDRAVANKELTIAYCERWIAHYDLRLEYEKAMLDAVGASALLVPKLKPVQLPLCNYRAPEGLTIPNKYTRGEMIHYPQIEMTKTEYAQINQDYRGTRVVGNTHRVRTTMQHRPQHAAVCVFLTDAGTKAPPAAQETPVPYRSTAQHTADLQAATARAAARNETEIRTRNAPIDAIRETLRAGVQVVSAPQLFPTPTDIARQIIALAQIEPGQCVLEPSAGTGNLVQAVIDTVDTEVLAYEINRELCAALARKFPSYKLQVRQADFLTVTDFQGLYPRVVMNPPFNNGADIKHIEHARTFLAPGGRLVAICANGPRQRAAFEPIAEAWIDLPDGTFKDQGTNVRTAIVVLRAE